ncbi:uncharacterized protein LOC132932606 [Metopolophium dirhodum]|uniref:uncharacterized protein LOC132932606 n=1 Tax=Metopolophium dirhodum TaxID=44670 RepID=UPI00298F433A|nr:uncharacterized protein LOC132932606 [Metopolophium dirhodum]
MSVFNISHSCTVYVNHGQDRAQPKPRGGPLKGDGGGGDGDGGGGGGRDRKCYNCGKQGHLSRDCAKSRGGPSKRGGGGGGGGGRGRDDGRRRGGDGGRRRPSSSDGLLKTASPRPKKDLNQTAETAQPPNELYVTARETPPSPPPNVVPIADTQ